MVTLDAQKRIVMVIPFPFQGHVTPMLRLRKILHSNGFSIIGAHTEFNSLNPLDHPEFVFLPLADGLSSYDMSFGNMLAVIKAMNTNCRGPLVEYLVQTMKDPEVFGQVSCIIYDFIAYCGDAVTTHLSLPSMVFRPVSASYMHSYHVILQLQAEEYFPLPESQLRDPVPNLHHLRFKDLPLLVSSKISDRLLEHFANNISIGSSVAVIWNTTEDLERLSLSQLQELHEVPFFPIGPIHRMTSTLSTSLMKEDRNCMMWLARQAPNSVLYESLGSLATIDEKDLEETAWGLADSGQPFLWVVRPSSVKGLQWIEQLPKGFREVVGQIGCIVKWAPQKEVLARSAVGRFFSHCGWNSTLESIGEGVPMICRPCFGDQLVNARYLSYIWKAGLELENAKDRVVIAISFLLERGTRSRYPIVRIG